MAFLCRSAVLNCRCQLSKCMATAGTVTPDAQDIECHSDSSNNSDRGITGTPIDTSTSGTDSTTIILYVNFPVVKFMFLFPYHCSPLNCLVWKPDICIVLHVHVHIGTVE